MKITCPDTGREIPIEHLNVQSDVAFSPFTGETHQLSKLVRKVKLSSRERRILAHPPAGVRLYKRGEQFDIRAKVRGSKTFLIVLSALVWCTFVSIMLIAPYWADQNAEGSDLPIESFRFGQDLGYTLFMTPFILLGLWFLLGASFSILGHFKVSLRGVRLSIYRGIGPFGFTRKFDALKVSKIRIRSFERQKVVFHDVELFADRRFRFGSSLNEQRVRYIAAAMRSELHVSD